MAEGDASGQDVRHLVIRLRDGAGSVLFEGTMQEAAEMEFDPASGLPVARRAR